MKKIGLWLELIVQFCWLVFLMVLVFDSGTIRPASLFLNPKYYWLLYLSMAYFAAFLSNTLIKILQGGDYKGRFPVFLYLLIPLFLFPTALRAELGSSAVERRGVVFQEVKNNEAETEVPKAEAEVPKAEAEVPKTEASDFEAPEFKNDDGTDRFIKILTEPEKNVGRQVTLVGQAAFNPRLPEGSFYIFKFIIFCCVADATPAGFIVTGLDASTVEADRWYKITETVGMTDLGGNEYISVQGDSLEPVNKPKSPYEAF